MNKIAVLSTNENPDYFFYAPIVEWAWNKFGWDIALFVTDECPEIPMRGENTIIHQIPYIEGVRSGTLAQCVRHFVSNVLPFEDYIMVQDIDLIPLKPWEPDLTAQTIWGWELTGHSFIPVHYTGMIGDKWYSLMGCTGDLKADMEREMKENGRAYKEKWDDYWDADWDILTKKVLAKKSDFTFIERGLINLGKYSTPKGRVDRCSIEVSPIDNSYSWGYTLNQNNLIDMHCENNNPSSPEKWKMIREVLVNTFKEIPDWMDSYVETHHKQYGK